MVMTVSSPVTGGAQTGFTSPTYTLVDDVPPNSNSKQKAVSAVGGAGNTPSLHSASNPFTVTTSRPAVLKAAPVVNPITGVMGNSPRNVYSVIVRKGHVPGSAQNPQISVIRADFPVVAGADVQDPINVRAGASLAIGAIWQMSAGIGDTMVSGLL